ncbi:MAG: hypothetical protein CVV46_13455 [Spirochaetae bacterium HGW-Spirochaetae-2]|jgi:oligogalacturonide transport system substrate-binding protein|nr:MAG: hypothetical protein CVV46_13455 [Spirochaetae bacterium HGW-Spirochaetae-2]
MKQHRIFSILAVSLLVLVISMPAIFAAGGKEAQPAADKPIALRFSWWGADTRHQATLEAIELYQQRNPNITIEGEYGAFSNFYQKLLTQLAGRTAPDIITVDYKWVSDLMNQGAPFVNMNTLTGAIDQSGFDLTFANIYGGKDDYLIGLPVGLNGMGYLYNTRFLEKYGVKSSDEWTWETVIEMGKKVQAADKTKYLMYNNAEHWVYLIKTMLKQINGNTLLLDNYELGFSRNEMLQIFAYIDTMVKTGTVPPFNEGVLYETVYADQNPNWLNENFGIFPTSSSLIPGIAKASNFTVASMRYPVAKNAKDPGILVTPSMFLTVYKQSPNKEAAAEFINFFLNDEEAIRILKDTRGIPTNSKAKNILVADNVIPQVVSDMVSQALTGVGAAENGPSLNPEVIALTKDFVQQVGYAKMTPAQATDAYMRELSALAKTIQ